VPSKRMGNILFATTRAAMLFKIAVGVWFCAATLSALGQARIRPAVQRIAVAAPPAANGYSLVFSDDFDASNISPNGSGAYNWYRGIWFEKPPSSSLVTVANSVLTLTWQLGSGNDTAITTFARDGSQGQAWRYGYFEVRAKWLPEPGAWPALWMLPRQAINSAAPEAGELDIFEGQGSQPRIFYGSIHDWRNNGTVEARSNNPDWSILRKGTDFSRWHTYGCLWTQGHVSWYFDNQLVLTSSTPPIFDQQDYYLILGMQAGANWTYGDLQGITPKTMQLEVDWVRVWQPSRCQMNLAGN
jgi:beta-glucanase (GH16 family)